MLTSSVSRLFCWCLAVEGIMGNNHYSSTTVSRRLGWRLAVEGIVGDNRQKQLLEAVNGAHDS